MKLDVMRDRIPFIPQKVLGAMSSTDFCPDCGHCFTNVMRESPAPLGAGDESHHSYITSFPKNFKNFFKILEGIRIIIS